MAAEAGKQIKIAGLETDLLRVPAEPTPQYMLIKAIEAYQHMALPPSGLTQLLYATNGSTESVVDALQRSGCLSAKALGSLDELKAFLDKAADAHSDHFVRLGPSATGPSLPDALVSALKESSFLSRKGGALSRTP